jgi:biopolymer transport protein ExbB
MNCKALTIAAAIVLLTGIGAGQALAKTNTAAKPAAQAATTASTPAAGSSSSSATTPGTSASGGSAATTGSGSANATAGGTTGATPAAPAAAPKVTPPKAPTGPNPYGIGRLWDTGGFITRGIISVLGLMSAGTWYIFFVKMWEQSRMLSQAKQVEKKFWSSNNLNEGIDNLAKNSVFRSVAEGGVRASQTSNTGLVNLNDWIAMSLNRQLEEINSRLQGGIAFLASVGSTAPFVGLFGTVWGILNALLAIGISGNPSIEKVAGPVGEALIMTAFGLITAVPAVLLYNFLVRRNKVINEKLRSFAADLQTYLVVNKK